MTIETKSSQNTSRPTSGADAHHAKSKPGATGNSGQGAPGGFMAILASLDTSELAVATTPAATDPALQACAAGVAAADGNNGGLKPALPDGLRELVTDGDGSVALGDAVGKQLQDIPTDTSAANLPLLTDAAATVLPAVTELPPQASALLAQSLQWTAAPASSPEPEKSDQAAGGAAGMGLGIRSQLTAEMPQRAQVLGDWGGESAKESIAKSVRLQRDAVARQASVDAALAVPTDVASQPDSRISAFLAAKLADQPATPMTTALAMANTLVPTRRDESTRERSVFRPTVPDGGAMAQTYAPTAAGAPSTPTTSASENPST